MVESVNPAFAEAFGLAHEAVVGTQLGVLIPRPEAADRWDDVDLHHGIARLLGEDEVTGGRVAPVLVRAFAVPAPLSTNMSSLIGMHHSRWHR
jgi:PAS domain-containing protein